jgi:predicted RNase H-like HicB family nuclease
MKLMKSVYTAIITPEDNMYVVLNPETGVTTQGETVKEALKNLEEAISLYLEETGEEKHLVSKPLITTIEV